ncbi:MAG: hypothetical protein HXY52_00675 [Nitrospirae bacterium]|jgi:hypothetical protein|nr:hypothetical protein [Nitrospirota bacterium]
MDINPANKIYETTVIKREENTNLPDKKKHKKEKKNQDRGDRKIDIKV